MSAIRCEWCAINSGRTHANRKCCQLRRLASSPRHVRVEFAQTLTDTEQADLRPRLSAEIKRLRDLRLIAKAAPAASAGPPDGLASPPATGIHPTQNKRRHALKIESDT